MSGLATAERIVTVVATTAERGLLFPSPVRGTCVLNRQTRDIEEFDGSVWASFINASFLYRGDGSPEGAVAADPGSIYCQDDATPHEYPLWYKDTGSGDTGWVQGNDFQVVGIKADTISESTADAGVTVDGVLLKDGGITGDGSLLVNLDADQLTSGIVASARISGDYTGVTAVGTLTSLTVSGDANVIGNGYFGDTAANFGNAWGAGLPALVAKTGFALLREANGAGLSVGRINGTFAAPSGINSGDIIGYMQFVGYLTAGVVAPTMIRSVAKETWGAGQGAEVQVHVTAVGSATATRHAVAFFGSDGGFTVGTSVGVGSGTIYSGAILPGTTATYDLGSASFTWNNLYAADVLATTYVSVGATPATSGAVRLTNTQFVTSRNNANSANLQLLGANNGDALVLGDTNNTLSGINLTIYTKGWTITGAGYFVPFVDATQVIGTAAKRVAEIVVSGDVIVGTDVAIGTNPASVGPLRFANGGQAWARNAANSGDVPMIGVDASNNVVVGGTGATAVVVYNTMLPNSDASKDLGSATFRWNHLYTAAGAVHGTDPGGSSTLRVGGNQYLNGLLGVGADAATQNGIKVSVSITAVSGAAVGVNSVVTMVASANSNTLAGLSSGSSTTLTVGAYTGVKFAGLWSRSPTVGSGTVSVAYGLLIDNVTVGSTNYAILTGTGLSQFGDSVNVVSGKAYQVGLVQVVGARVTGWAQWTGTANRATKATGTALLGDVAQTLKALIDDLFTHGLIGT